MTRRRHPAVKPQRKCALCGAGIAEQRPVFLVASFLGAIVGPYHAGCAARFMMAAERGESIPNALPLEKFGSWPSRREETIPW